MRPSRRAPGCQPQVFAAVDLGSNSFHLVVARQRRGELEIIDRLQEMVRLAAGLDDEGYLTTEASGRALACLARGSGHTGGAAARS